MDLEEGKLFIGGIAWDTSEETLTEYFTQYGQVTQAIIMREKPTGRPRGFGFVVFSDPSVLDRVLQDRHTIDGRTRRKKFSEQQKREHLEREVSMLQKMLNQEENMHEVLEHILNQHNGSAVSIPNFLPPKIRQLLAELAMVEGEILRLEGQISELQKSLKLEQELTEESKSKQWKHGTLSNRVGRSSPTTNTNPINKVGNETMAYETKALHFISKAIKGDYNLNDFTIAEKLGNSRGFADQKENLLHEAVKFQDKIPRKSGMLKPFSPLREPRHPSPKWLVLLPVVLTLIATNNNDSKIVDAIADLCYTKWALEAFVIANAKRYSGAWLITRCGSLMTSGYDLNHWYRCLAFLILTGILFRAIAFFFMVTFQKK